MRVNFKRMLKIKKLENPEPVILDINPTDNCNLSCLSCWKRNPKYKNLSSDYYELSDDRLIELIDEASKLGIKEIEITGGGEPLLRKVTFTLMKKIKDKEIKGSITTNSVLINEKLAKELVNIGWDRIVFSIDGPSKEVNDYLRGKSFDKIIENINLMNKHKEETRKTKPVLYFNVVLSNKNYNLIDKFINLAKKLKIEFIKFETLTIHSGLGEKLQLNDKQNKEFLGNIKKYELLAKKAKIKTNLSDFSEELIEKPNRMDKNIPMCFEPFYHIVVKTDGSVGPCCLFYGNAPNIKEASLAEIWNGKYFENIRESFKNGKMMDYCKICNLGQVATNIKMMENIK